MTNRPPNRPPAFALLFQSIFGFIGIAVLIFLWTASGFGAPPFFFRVFGSFIALAFIVMGFGAPLHALKNGQNAHMNPLTARATPRKPGSYDCPNCGANIEDGEVSPSGDIKCDYCGEWWNIHGR